MVEVSRNQAFGCGSCLLAFFVLVVTFWYSFHTLEFTELGLDFNIVTYSVDASKAYPNGRWLLGPFHQFIDFPGQVQSINIQEGLRSRTSDGLEVSLSVTFQYRLSQDRLYDLYEKFGTDYEKVFRPLAINTLTQKATEFDASTFFGDRNLVSTTMAEAMQEIFQREAFCDVPNFQLLTVSLPTQFQSAIQTTEVAKQDIETASAERLNQVVAAFTEVLKAQLTAERVMITADASARTIELQNEAFVEQFNLTQTLQAESFQSLAAELEGREDLLIEYLDVRALRDHPSGKTVVNMGNPTGTPSN